MGVVGNIGVIALTSLIEAMFPLGDWRWGVIVLGCAVLWWLMYVTHRPFSVPVPALQAPAERQAWEIPGARRDEYPIYEAACLLANEPVTWPLSPRAQDEYEAIMVWRPPVTVHGSPDTQRAAVVERSGPRNLDSGLSEISIVFQAAVPKPVAPKYTTSGVRRPSEL